MMCISGLSFNIEHEQRCIKLFNSYYLTYQSYLLILLVCSSIFILYCVSEVYVTKIGACYQCDEFDNYGFPIDTSSNSKGFILVNTYFEQQVGAAMNLLTLSKWAKTVGAFPVEPFVKHSSFHNYIHVHLLKNTLFFHDYFDVEVWNRLCININAMPLISLNTFIAHNPGKFILVLHADTKLSKLAFVDDEIVERTICKKIFLEYERKLHNYITKTLSTNMETVRRVCISVNHKPIHINNFTNIIYGNFDPSKVVVWFKAWKGIAKRTRYKIIEDEYARNSEVIKMLQSSKRIIDDSNKYVKNILQSSFGNYVAVSFRSVKRAKHFYLNKRENPMEFFYSCILQLQKTINLMNSTYKIFLAQDLGRFGDIKASTYLTDSMMDRIEDKLFQSLYNGNLTMKEWEEEFVYITDGITDSGYIAAMQSEILTKSRCLVMFGGNSYFQRSILHRYKQFHSNNDSCIYEVCYIP